ncbi:MAG: aconitase X swivel domain-containing protein [Candidatus Njordarchaeales archaeon]
MTKSRELFGEIINPWTGIIRGKAIVSSSKISFLGDVDIETGIIVDPFSDIRGRSIRNTVFIFRGGRGSTVGASVIYGLAKRGNAPLALVTIEVDPVVVAGAIFAGIPMISRVPEEIFDIVSSGDIVELIPENSKKAMIRVLKG